LLSAGAARKRTAQHSDTTTAHDASQHAIDTTTSERLIRHGLLMTCLRLLMLLRLDKLTVGAICSAIIVPIARAPLETNYYTIQSSADRQMHCGEHSTRSQNPPELAPRTGMRTDCNPLSVLSGFMGLTSMDVCPAKNNTAWAPSRAAQAPSGNRGGMPLTVEPGCTDPASTLNGALQAYYIQLPVGEANHRTIGRSIVPSRPPAVAKPTVSVVEMIRLTRGNHQAQDERDETHGMAAGCSGTARLTTVVGGQNMIAWMEGEEMPVRPVMGQSRRCAVLLQVSEGGSRAVLSVDKGLPSAGGPLLGCSCTVWVRAACG
jgi:hypothetical protein